jgi:hypothetical protein
MTGIEINENLVEELLKKAGAPLVASQEGLAALTMSLSEIANYASAGIPSKVMKRAEYLDEGDKLGCDLKRAQAAAEELRLVVPEITAALRTIVMGKDQSKVNEIEAWLNAMPDFLPPKKKREWQHTWAIHAVWLFSAYQRATGPCGASREGKAVKFIKLAFDHCGIHKDRTAAAIAKVIVAARNQPDAFRYFLFDVDPGAPNSS